MRAVLEAVADFFSKHGAAEEAATLTDVMAKMGYEVAPHSSLRWRQLIAAMRQELNDPERLDYAFFFGRLISFSTHAKMPKELSKAVFSSKMFLHILAERFASSFGGIDANSFKLESDVLSYSDGILGSCLLLQSNLFSDESERSRLGRFLDDFLMIFEDDEPKERWEEFYALHRVNYASFRRDMKRALWRIEDALVGPTKLELLAHMLVDEQEAAAMRPKKRICRAALENKFSGSPEDWKNLSVVNSVRLETEQEQNAIDDGEPSQESISSEPSQEETRVWSTRLPFATSGSTSDSSVSEIDDDGVPPSSDSPAPSPPAATSSQRARPSSASSMRDDPLLTRSDAPANETAASTTPAATTTSTASGGDAEASDTNNAAELSVQVRTKRKRWTQAEVDALQKGYKQFSALPNVWVMIKSKYASVLSHRSNVDIKDKYRNLLKSQRLVAAAQAQASDE